MVMNEENKKSHREEVRPMVKRTTVSMSDELHARMKNGLLFKDVPETFVTAK